MMSEIKVIDETATSLQYAVASNVHNKCQIFNEGPAKPVICSELDSDVASTTDNDLDDDEQPQMISRVISRSAYHEIWSEEWSSDPEAAGMDGRQVCWVPLTYQAPLPSQNGPVALMHCPSIAAVSTCAQPSVVSQLDGYLQQAAARHQPGPHYGDSWSAEYWMEDSQHDGYLQRAAAWHPPEPHYGDSSSEDNSSRRRGSRHYQADMHSFVPDHVQEDIQGDDKIKREAAIAKVSAIAVQLAFAKDGCRLLQWTLENTEMGTAAQLAAQLQGQVRDLCKSPHGNYVVQKIITVLPTAHASFVAEELCGAGPDVARHRYGCRVICRLIEHAAENHWWLTVLLNELLQDLSALSRSEFGHYVIECLFEHGTIAQRSEVVETLCSKLRGSIMNRNSGFVIEKILMHDPGAAERTRLLQAVAEAIASGNSDIHAALEKIGRLGNRISLALKQGNYLS